MSALLQLCDKCPDTSSVHSTWLWSEKLDGMRCFWDGGITRGWAKNQVPWAYCAKDGRLKVIPKATGLWTRYGGVIQAPDWWIEQLPKGIMLDGELHDWKLRQDLLSIVKGGGDWKNVGYKIYDAPPPACMLDIRTMVVTGTKVGINYGPTADRLRTEAQSASVRRGMGFKDRLAIATAAVGSSTVATVLPQTVVGSTENLENILTDVLKRGGEGLVVRHPDGLYLCKRHKGILKLKGMDEDEATVTGVTDGLGKHEGRIGALVCKWKNLTINLGSGLTDSERELKDWVGQVVTFRYRGVSRDGYPQEPRFVRRRNYENG